MSMASLEQAILAELKIVAKNDKIKMKDIIEWSCSEVEAHEGETLFFLPKLHVNVAVKLPT
jgi:hypothetical protein